MAGGRDLFQGQDRRLDRRVTLGIFGAPTTSKTHTRNYSVYGQVSYDLTDKLTLTGSLRYANERKSVAFPPPNPVTNIVKVDKFIPAGTLSYKLGDGTLYVRYAKGFKTGGPNPLVRPDRLPADQRTGLILAPETVDTYEAGYRAELFNRRVQFTSAVFYNKYKGVHTTTNGTVGNSDISNALINLGNARTYGAEASLDVKVSDPLTVSANIGYLNARYKNADFVGNAFLNPVFASGNRMILAPEWQGGVRIAYDQAVSDKYRIKANALYAYISHVFYNALEQPTVDQPGYSIVNLRAGVATVDDRLGIYAFANNLFDKRFFVFGATSGVGDFETPGDPRIIGVSLEFNY